MLKKNIIAHRGLWLNNSEKNTLIAFHRALENGFGIETDIRDFDGKIVISHDLPESQSIDLQLYHLLKMKLFSETQGRMALNVKSSGLASAVSMVLTSLQIDHSRFYVFDMAVPDMMPYIDSGLDIYSRISDQEPIPAFKNSIRGVWVDDLSGNFDQVQAAKDSLDQSLRVTIVSPELHGRNHEMLWSQIVSHGLHKYHNFELCTDLPLEAANTFSDS